MIMTEILSESIIEKIYNVNTKAKNVEPGIKIADFKNDSHLIEILNGEKTVRVCTEAFEVMTKTYISQLVQENNKLREGLKSQERTIKKLESLIERTASIAKNNRVNESVVDYSGKIRELESKIRRLEIQANDDR